MGVMSRGLRGPLGAGPWRGALVLLLLVATTCWAQRPPAAKPRPAAAAKPAAVAPAPAQAERPYRVGAVPAWVVESALPERLPPQPAPMVYRLVEEQHHVDGAGASEFSRVVRVVRDANGLGPAAQWELRFDPSYQTLTLHRIDVLRGGMRQARLPTQRVEVLQREEKLEQRLYDGQLSLSIVLDDIRVGDEIEVAYTISGANPVFGGRYVQMTWLGSERGPVARWHTRLLAPAARTIHARLGLPDVRTQSAERAGWRETTWVRDDVPAIQVEPGTPWSALLPEVLQLSEFADWAEVARWGEALFAERGESPGVAARASEILGAHATPQARLEEALRFVQQDVRYFGIAIGPGSHRPNPPQRVLDQRFGDCKDKVMLLAALLRRLELPVRPVLVSTRMRERVDEMLPSPLAFDHVIARVDLDGRALWLDPTRAQQSGPLAARQVVFSRGLELAGGSQALSRLPEPYERTVLTVDDTLAVTDFSRGAELVSRITWHGELAEGIRHAVAERGAAAFADQVSTHYVRVYPGLKRLEAPRTEDSRDDDAVTLVQRYALPELWRYDRRVLQADALMWAGIEALMPPKTEGRRHALGLENPGRYRHRVRVDFPEPVFREPSSRQVDERDKHFELTVDVEGGVRHIEYRADVRLRTDRVEPADWNAYQQALQRALPRLSMTFAVPAMSLARTEAVLNELVEVARQSSRRNRPAPTGVQLRAQVETRAMTAQIEGGRLPPMLRQQALVARGIAWDHLGDSERARADFDAALALKPDDVPALKAAATNAQSRGQIEQVLQYTDRVLERHPRDAEALATRARALYLADRFAEAQADLERVLEQRSESRSGYPLIWMALATARSGGDLKALRERHPPSSWPTGWPRPVIEVLLADGDPAGALKAARDSRQPQEAQTEAQFYLAERRAIAGDLDAARDGWKRAVDLGVTEFVEHAAARQRLARFPR